MNESLHPSAPHDLPGFITAPGDTDILMVVMGIILIGAILMMGILYLRLHALPEQMAHKSQTLQFEIVAVLGLLALFTHTHLFWVIGLLLAMIDLPDWGTPLRSIAGSVKQMDDSFGRSLKILTQSRNARPTNPSTVKRAPATIIKCGYPTAASISQ